MERGLYMKLPKLKWIGVLLVVFLLVGTSLIPPAHAQIAQLEFTSASATCLEGAYTLHNEALIGFNPFGLRLAMAQPVFGSYTVEARDADSTFLGSDAGTFNPLLSGDYSGSITFLTEPAGPTVTFYLYFTATLPTSMPELFGGPGSASAQSDPGEAGDTMVAAYTPCATPGVTALPDLPRPGCDLVDLTGAAVGRFVASTLAYYAPNLSALTYPAITIDADTTLWVFGQDVSHQYYKVQLGCSTLWVPVESMGPNDAYPWYGTPLPAAVVD